MNSDTVRHATLLHEDGQIDWPRPLYFRMLEEDARVGGVLPYHMRLEHTNAPGCVFGVLGAVITEHEGRRAPRRTQAESPHAFHELQVEWADYLAQELGFCLGFYPNMADQAILAETRERFDLDTLQAIQTSTYERYRVPLPAVLRRLRVQPAPLLADKKTWTWDTFDALARVAARRGGVGAGFMLDNWSDIGPAGWCLYGLAYEARLLGPVPASSIVADAYAVAHNRPLGVDLVEADWAMQDVREAYPGGESSRHKVPLTRLLLALGVSVQRPSRGTAGYLALAAAAPAAGLHLDDYSMLLTD